jgi:hypothetical protein
MPDTLSMVNNRLQKDDVRSSFEIFMKTSGSSCIDWWRISIISLHLYWLLLDTGSETFTYKLNEDNSNIKILRDEYLYWHWKYAWANSSWRQKSRARMRHQCSLNTSIFTCVYYLSLSLIFYTPRVRVSTIFFTSHLIIHTTMVTTSTSMLN